MKPGLLLASRRGRPRSEAEVGGCQSLSDLDLSPSDIGYLRLAQLLLTGRDRRPLPEDEKVDFLVS